ncbi:MAG: tRNA (adenosine(37)-N6)-threonylcarbamoyltransferase complex dimerization subunit type 1 TsaB [Clostridia bacterium]|nr:tRNA (adenosine(37)-N6)-threonylcarbamoyltransferase complex dimerization subunit type 1 TsaB [Clostridia bacterium]
MKILAIDTSGPNCSVAIIDDNKVVADFTINNGTTHSQNLVPMVEQVQKFTNIELSDIDAFACSIGPGSFTGLRIGIATIKGFAMSLNKPVLSVPTLLALAYNVCNFDGVICSIIDARNDNVYAGIYRSSEEGIELVDDYVSDNIEILIDKLKDFDDNIIFVGDGVETYKDLLLENLKSDSKEISFATSHLNCQYALSVARAAKDMALKNEYNDYNSLSPLYLKKSQAERELDAKQS